jgi:hypothetical protein
MTSRAPVISGQKNSHTETSKLNGVFCNRVAGGQLIGVLHPQQAVDHPAMFVDHAFRLAGGAGGVDHVRGVFGVSSLTCRLSVGSDCQCG